MPAMWGGVAAAAGAVGGALIANEGARSASGAQTEGTRAAIGEQRRQFDLSRDDLAGYRSAGKSALSRISTGLGFAGPSSIDENDPRFQALLKPALDSYEQQHQDRFGMSIYDSRADAASRESTISRLKDEARTQYMQRYGDEQRQSPEFGSLNRKFTMDDFRDDPVTKASFESGLSEGEKAVQRMFGARGLSRSGAAVKAASRFATDYTGTKAGESYGRFYADQDRTFNREAAVAGIGQTASTSTASLGAQTSGNVSGMLTAEGNARGAAAIARSNAMGGAVNQVGNQVYGQYTLDRILNPRGGVTNAPGAGAPSFTMDSYVPDSSRVVT